MSAGLETARKLYTVGTQNFQCFVLLFRANLLVSGLAFAAVLRNKLKLIKAALASIPRFKTFLNTKRKCWALKTVRLVGNLKKNNIINANGVQ